MNSGWFNAHRMQETFKSKDVSVLVSYHAGPGIDTPSNATIEITVNDEVVYREDMEGITRTLLITTAETTLNVIKYQIAHKVII